MNRALYSLFSSDNNNLNVALNEQYLNIKHQKYSTVEQMTTTFKELAPSQKKRRLK